MDIYLETRGSARSTGYRFLGAGPGDSWWRHRYGRRTAFEYPTILVERDADGWRAYLSGMLSSRREPGGSANRVALVMESTDAAGAGDRQLVLRLVATWLEDTAAGGSPSRLQAALDATFTEEVVTRLYGEDGSHDVESLVGAVAAGLDPAEAGGAAGPTPSWIAPIRSPAARRAFLGRVDALVAGRVSGAAVLVNLVDDGESFERGPGEPEMAVLVMDPDGRIPDGPAPLPLVDPAVVAPPGKDVRPPALPRGRAHRSPLRPTVVIPAVLILAVAVLAAIWWLVPALTPGS